MISLSTTSKSASWRHDKIFFWKCSFPRVKRNRHVWNIWTYSSWFQIILESFSYKIRMKRMVWYIRKKKWQQRVAQIIMLLYEKTKKYNGKIQWKQKFPAYFTLWSLIDAPPLINFSKKFHPGHSYSNLLLIKFWKNSFKTSSFCPNSSTFAPFLVIFHPGHSYSNPPAINFWKIFHTPAYSRPPVY